MMEGKDLIIHITKRHLDSINMITRRNQNMKDIAWMIIQVHLLCG